MRFRRLISRVHSPAAAPVVIDIRQLFNILIYLYMYIHAYIILQLHSSISGLSEESGNLHSLIKPRRPHAEAYTATYIHIVIHIIYKDINDRSGLPRVNQRGGQGNIEMERDRLYIETRTVRRIIIDKNVLYM